MTGPREFIFGIFFIAILTLVFIIMRCSLATRRLEEQGRIAMNQVVMVDDKTVSVKYAEQSYDDNEWEFIVDVNQGGLSLYRAQLRDVEPEYKVIDGKRTLTEFTIASAKTLNGDRRWIDATVEQTTLLRRAMTKILQNTYFSIQHNYLLED